MMNIQNGSYELIVFFSAVIGAGMLATAQRYSRTHSIKEIAKLIACLVVLIGLALSPNRWRFYTAVGILLMCIGDALDWWRKRHKRQHISDMKNAL